MLKPLHRADKPALLVLCLVAPWIVLLLVTEGYRLERSWFLWPLQTIAIASVITWLPSRLGSKQSVMWTGSIVLVILLAGNSLALSRLQSWVSDGWSGQDPAQIHSIDFIAGRLRVDGAHQASIGYEIFTPQFMGMFNSVDERYKIGANFDTVFKYRHGIANLNTCAEGVSPHDEYRIVQTSAAGIDNPYSRYRLSVPRGQGFEVVYRSGNYEVLKAPANGGHVERAEK
jgi:hypothetical protein